MRMKKPAVVLATAALMTLAACGGGSGNSTSTGNKTLAAGGAAGSFKNKDAKAPLAMPSDASEGGTLTVLTNQVPAYLDPTQAYFTDSTAILSDLVTRSLTQYAYNEKTNDMQLIPDMATDLGRPSSDNKSWTFTLRDGLKYEDGSPVKAEDVAYAVKRSFAIAELPEGPTYNTTFFLDGDKYKGPFKDKGEYKGVVVKGNDITIKMRRPFTDMDYYASFPSFTAIPQA
jgi:peptide/nickel transport system substrate-binding protein